MRSSPCVRSVSSPIARPLDGVPCRHVGEEAEGLHRERSFVCRSQADRRGSTQWNHRRGRGPPTSPAFPTSRRRERGWGTILLSILCGALFGLAPAVQKPLGGMRSGRTLTTVSHATVRQWLVITQIAASMVLLAGTMLLMRSFSNLENQNLGMRTDNTLTASITLGEHNFPRPKAGATSTRPAAPLPCHRNKCVAWRQIGSWLVTRLKFHRDSPSQT